MSPFAPQVVIASALMSSPVFYQTLVARTAAVDFALTRFLVIWVATWVIVSLVTELLFPSRLETERRIRDIELAARDMRKAVEKAEAEAARERDEAAAGLRTLDEILHPDGNGQGADSEHEAATGTASREGSEVPPQRSGGSDVSERSATG